MRGVGAAGGEPNCTGVAGIAARLGVAGERGPHVPCSLCRPLLIDETLIRISSMRCLLADMRPPSFFPASSSPGTGKQIRFATIGMGASGSF